jgi:acetyl esterase/lipase
MVKVFSFWLCVAACLMCQGCNSVMLAAANAPSVYGPYEVQRDIAYGELPAQRLDIYRPNLDRPRGLVVFFHGGGWSSGSKSEYRFVAEALTSRGYVVAVPAYRLYPHTTFPGFVEDGALAVAWVRAHAAQWNVAGDGLFVMGHSAGAHIAAMLTYDEHYLRAVGESAAGPRWIRGFVGMSGPYDFFPFQYGYLHDIFLADSGPKAQPVNFVDGNEPPALLLHGTEDVVVYPYNTEHLAARIRERHGEVQDKYYPGMSHGGMLAAVTKYFRSRRTVLNDVDGFLTDPHAIKSATL